LSASNYGQRREVHRHAEALVSRDLRSGSRQNKVRLDAEWDEPAE
jgi:hypothetical protein